MIVCDVKLQGEAMAVAIPAGAVVSLASAGPSSIAATPRIGVSRRPGLIECVLEQSDQFVVLWEIDQYSSAG
jgi:hypothetical protein